MHNNIGLTFRDRITGFQGVATGRLEYISGCNQLLLTPMVTGEGTMRDGNWIDEQRLDHRPEFKRIELDNGATPGFGQAPPKSGI